MQQLPSYMNMVGYDHAVTGHLFGGPQAPTVAIGPVVTGKDLEILRANAGAGESQLLPVILNSYPPLYMDHDKGDDDEECFWKIKNTINQRVADNKAKQNKRKRIEENTNNSKLVQNDIMVQQVNKKRKCLKPEKKRKKKKEKKLKNKINCKYFLEGKCKKGNECEFSHKAPLGKVKPKVMCKFFLEGKCVKGNECTFSHDGVPLKKRELCKFYVNDVCTKGKDCLYMHKDFPCKYFQTGAVCFAMGNCKFSHGPLSDETRDILDRYLNAKNEEVDSKTDEDNECKMLFVNDNPDFSIIPIFNQMDNSAKDVFLPKFYKETLY